MICNYSDKIIVGTKEGKDGLVEYFGIKADKIKVIHLGIDPKTEIVKEDIDKYKEKFDGKKIILCFGVISPRKGQYSVITAFSQFVKKHTDYILVIAGSSSPNFNWYEKKIKNHVKDLGISAKVVFTGFVDQKEKEILFDLSEVAIYNYSPMSGSTHALGFAINHNKPIIASNLNTFTEVLGRDYVNLVKPDNTLDITKKLTKIIEDTDWRDKSTENYPKIMQEFSWQKTAKAHVNLYEKLLSE